jgi:hypothetical protein
MVIRFRLAIKAVREKSDLFPAMVLSNVQVISKPIIYSD